MFSIDLTYLCRHNIENTAGFNYMNRRYYCMFIVLFFAVLTQAAAAERTFNILFIQSYLNFLIERYHDEWIVIDDTQEGGDV